MDYYTAKELAGKPGMPTTERGIRDRAKKESWPSRKRTGRGGGREYPVTALPQETQNALLDQQIENLPEKVCLLPQVQDDINADLQQLSPRQVDTNALAKMKTWQQQTMDARLAIINLVNQAVGSGIKVTTAIETIIQRSKDNTLPPAIESLVPIANARSSRNKRATLSRRTLMNWWSAWKKADEDYTALAPKTVEVVKIPAWAPAFLKQYQVPQKISIARAIEEMQKIASPGDEIPSEGQVRNFLKKFSRLEIEKGRKSGSELRSQKLYRVRDTSPFWPLDIVVPDGHSFKARVPHPAHGRPFKPEICCFIDVVTRGVIGWSAGLSESTFLVADALRHAVTINDDKPIGGHMLFIYSDNGSGFCGKINTDEIAGLYPRLDVDFFPGQAGNPQARGVIERLNATLWIPAAKKLPTYCGKDMDSLTARNVYLQLEKDVRQAKKHGTDVKSDLMFNSWDDFLLFLQDEVDAYNHRPHSSLPRITDKTTGRRRHMTPAEMWANYIAGGWQPERLSDQELEHLFRPHEMVTTRRGIVRLHKKVYADPALEHYHGMQVMVGYDIHDPSRVWVRDSEGRLIVIAKLDANKSPFLPVSHVEQKREERYKNRMQTIERRAEEIELERRGGPVELQVVPEVIELDQDVIDTSNKIIARIENQQKTFATPWELYLDMSSRKDQLSAYQRTWLNDYETFTETGKKSQLLRADEFCTGEDDLNQQQDEL